MKPLSAGVFLAISGSISPPASTQWAGQCWLDKLDVLVWINPNNPTGKRIPPETLLRWLNRLQRRGGWLIVDEAFIDATPELVCASTPECKA